MSGMFEILKTRYEKNFVRKDQLRKYVELKKITPEEYELITGEAYSIGEDVGK